MLSLSKHGAGFFNGLPGPAAGVFLWPAPARTPDPSSGALRRAEASACGPKPSADGSGGRVGRCVLPSPTRCD